MAHPDGADGAGGAGGAEQIGHRFLLLADTELAGYSPLYDRLARHIAARPDLLAALAGRAPENQTPVRFFAAVHDLLLRQPDEPLAAIYRGECAEAPEPRFDALVAEHLDPLLDTMARRSIQTNEVGRSAGLRLVLAEVSATVGGPLALVEIGPSAGLNLLFDRYHVEFGGRLRAGPPDSPVRLTCELVGPGAPTAGIEVPVASRLGIDHAPVDVHDPDACRWLEACVWPDVPHRLDRLRAALAIARDDPPPIVRGDALDLLPGVLHTLPDGVVPCVVSTWVLAYLGAEARRAVHDVVAGVGARRDAALVTLEYPHVATWLPEPGRGAAVPGRRASLFGVARWVGGVEQTRAVAWMQSHGRWLDWLAPAVDPVGAG
jgi:hypothetical protein